MKARYSRFRTISRASKRASEPKNEWWVIQNLPSTANESP